MDATLRDGLVYAGRAAREQFHDARGYGYPVDDGDLVLAGVEAAHLLYREDLAAVDGMGLADFLASAAVGTAAFAVYKDLRDRGFYCSPLARPVHDAVPTDLPAAVDLVVHPRGEGPWDGAVAHGVVATSERDSVAPAALGDVVLAVVDEESEVTYLETGRPELTGTCPPGVDATVDGRLLDERVVCWSPPAALYERAFYGQPLDGDAGGGDAGDDADPSPVQLSLVEAAFLAGRGDLALDAEAVRERGRAVEGERFDRRLAVYEWLRDARVVPKTGFKFGADFRTYADFESVAAMDHSERLVRVVPAGDPLAPRDLALDVRMAHGVRKTMTYAVVEAGAGQESAPVRWIDVERLTP